MLTRRQACQTLVTGAAAATFGGPLTHADGKSRSGFTLNYSLASSIYGMAPLAEVLPEVVKIGADSIDLWPKRHGNQREQAAQMGEEKLRELLDQYGTRLGMTTRYDLGPFKLQEEVLFLNRFGGKMIVCGSKPAEGATLREQVQNFVKKLDEHVKFAEDHGVTIAIENHGNALIESPDSLRYLAEFSKSPGLGIAFAPYHLPQDPELIATLIRDLGPKLVHFYAWEHGDGCSQKLPKEQELKQLPGRGTLDFRPLLSALQSIEFNGWTQIFMHPVPRGIPIMENTQQSTDLILSSRTYLESLLV
ncbi:sugar phosphate isomerase/epimerase family protein [Planctomicrobium sp. SH664]|uniref:sugar phosphate isomerase/epimerase family protein n=1 Tax=Planctomicrobium sp. SH664 TaxID=3448125 RepID=UPI003F5CB38C